MAKTPLQYLNHVPRKIPLGRVIVHNRVHALFENQPPGMNGFRTWTVARLTASRNKAYIKCSCGWAKLAHYRIAALGDQADSPPPNVRGKKFTKAK
jgi:hypothetical protein